ncbi:DctP family TRAP transporter solute-binding subunit [Arsenicitalea aurantiaca]|nr:DctP family TRAP transporter solute-binding subunit [Arsenicitalea aurantiaca]
MSFNTVSGKSLAAAVALLALGMAGTAQGATLIKLGTNFASPDQVEYQAVQAFKRYVEFRSNGEIELRVFAESLGGDREIFEQVQQGSLELAFPADGAIAGFYAPVQVLSIPYAVTTSPVAWKFLESDFMRELTADMLEQTGVRTLVTAESGFRSMSNNVRQIREPADMEGLKMRTMQSPVYMEMMRALGATPTPLPATELVMSLRQGIVDGQENPIPAIADSGIGEVQSFVSADDHTLGVQFLVTNDDWWQTLDQTTREILQEGAHLLANYSQALKMDKLELSIQKLRDRGVDVYLNTNAEKEMFREAAQPAVRAFIEEQVGTELVERFLGAVEEANASVYSH